MLLALAVKGTEVVEACWVGVYDSSLGSFVSLVVF